LITRFSLPFPSFSCRKKVQKEEHTNTIQTLKKERKGGKKERKKTKQRKKNT